MKRRGTRTWSTPDPAPGCETPDIASPEDAPADAQGSITQSPGPPCRAPLWGTELAELSARARIQTLNPTSTGEAPSPHSPKGPLLPEARRPRGWSTPIPQGLHEPAAPAGCTRAKEKPGRSGARCQDTAAAHQGAPDVTHKPTGRHHGRDRPRGDREACGSCQVAGKQQEAEGLRFAVTKRAAISQTQQARRLGTTQEYLEATTSGGNGCSLSVFLNGPLLLDPLTPPHRQGVSQPHCRSWSKCFRPKSSALRRRPCTTATAHTVTRPSTKQISDPR